MTRWPLAATMAAVLAGCVFLPSGPTVATLRGPEGYELLVALYDPGGLVEAVDPAESDPTGPDDSLRVVGDDAAVLQWLGGACDRRAQINVLAQDRTISVAVRTDEAFGSCPAIGLPRAVTMTFRDRIGDRTLELAGHG